MTPRRSKTSAWAQVAVAVAGLVGCAALWLGPVETMVAVAASAPSTASQPGRTGAIVPIGTTTSVPTGLIRPYSSPNPNDERAVSGPTIAAVTVVAAPQPVPRPSSSPVPRPRTDPGPSPEADTSSSSTAGPVAPDSVEPSGGPLDGAGVEQRIIVEVPTTSTPPVPSTSIPGSSIPDGSVPEGSVPEGLIPDSSIPEGPTSTTDTDAPRAVPTPTPTEAVAAGPLPRTGSDGLTLRLAVVALALIDGGWLVRSLARARRDPHDRGEQTRRASTRP